MEQNQACEGGQNLQIILMNRFCKFTKSKTVNYHMQVSEGASRTRQDKIGRRLNPGRWTKVSCHDEAVRAAEANSAKHRPSYMWG
jgi:hypothetical protein